MRTIYIKNNKRFPFSCPYYWKVIEFDKETATTIQVTEDTINVEDSEDFFGQVSFIKNTLCKDEGCEEITREQFDDFYKKTVNLINLKAVI